VIGLIYMNFVIRTDGKFFILFGRFNLQVCNVCKVVMKGSHNLLVHVKVTKKHWKTELSNHYK